jgi:hypothetical protein
VTARILTRRALLWQLATGVVVLAIPAIGLYLLLTNPVDDLNLSVPLRHFVVVSAVSALAAGVAALLAVEALRAGDSRSLLLALGFMLMAGIFTIHGLATPGILVPAGPTGYGVHDHNAQGSVLGVSAFLSLALPALVFAVSHTPVSRLLQRMVSLRLAVGVGALGLLLAYGALALTQTSLVAGLNLNVPPGSLALAGASLVLLLLAGGAQLRSFLSTRRVTDWELMLAMLFLAEAQVAMALSTPFRASWWEYHALMLAAVQQAFKSLWDQRAAVSRAEAELEEALTRNPVLAEHALHSDEGAYRHSFEVAFAQATRDLDVDVGRLRAISRDLQPKVYKRQRGAPQRTGPASAQEVTRS